MAAVTIQIGEAGDGQLDVSLTYDDATMTVISATYTLLSGSAALVLDGVTVFPLSLGTRTFAVPGNRPLQNGRGIGFRWGAE